MVRAGKREFWSLLQGLPASCVQPSLGIFCSVLAQLCARGCTACPPPWLCAPGGTAERGPLQTRVTQPFDPAVWAGDGAVCCGCPLMLELHWTDLLDWSAEKCSCSGIHMWCNPRGPFPNTSEGAGHGNAVSCAMVQTWLQSNSHLDPIAQVRPEPIAGDNLLLPPPLHLLSSPPCC